MPSEQKCSAFVWKGDSKTSVGAKVAWSKLSCPKQEGGLGLKKIVDWTVACVLKCLGALFLQTGSL